MSITPQHYRTKPIEGDAVQWDGTYPQARSVVAWLTPYRAVSYVPASGPDDVATIRTEDGSVVIRPHDWILTDVDTLVVLIDDELSQWFEPVKLPSPKFRTGQGVLLVYPGDGEADTIGHVATIRNDGMGGATIYTVDWSDPIGTDRDHIEEELKAAE